MRFDLEKKVYFCIYADFKIMVIIIIIIRVDIK
jgi:hypothetical protein